MIVNGVEEAHGEQDEIGFEGKGGIGQGFSMGIDADDVEIFDMTVMAVEMCCHNAEIAFCAFGLTGRGTHFKRPIGPDEGFIFVFGGLRHQFELDDIRGALPKRGADTIAPGIAAADDDNMALFCADRLCSNGFAAIAVILLGEEIHGEMDAVEIASGDWQIAGLFASAAQQDRVEIVSQGSSGEGCPDMMIAMKVDAFADHLLDAPFDVIFFEFKVGDPVAEQATGVVVFFVDVDVMADAGELLGGGETGGAGTDDGDTLASFRQRGSRFDPSLLPSAIGDGAFDSFDCDGGVFEVEGAGGFAGSGTDPSGNFGEIIGAVEIGGGAFPVLIVDEVVPIGNLIIDGTAGVTIGHPAIHTSGSLSFEIVIG